MADNVTKALDSDKGLESDGRKLDAWDTDGKSMSPKNAQKSPSKSYEEYLQMYTSEDARKRTSKANTRKRSYKR